MPTISQKLASFMPRTPLRQTASTSRNIPHTSPTQAILLDQNGAILELFPSTRLLFSDSGASLIALDAPGRIALDGGDGLRLVDASGKLLLKLESADARLMSLQFSPDGSRIAAGHLDGTVSIWSTQSGRLLSRLRAHLNRVPSVIFDRTGSLLISASWDGQVRLWGLGVLDKSPEQLRTELETSWGLSL